MGVRKILERLHVVKPKQVIRLSAIVTRADGTVEDLGVISETKSKGWEVKSNG